MSHDDRLPDPARIVLRRRIADFTFGATPRLAVSASFSRPLRFNDPVDVELAVAAIGHTSLDYRVSISADDGAAAEGSVKVCLIDRATVRATPWPDDVRERLAAGGLQDAGR
jgi:acyl-CoA thioesterase FadM